MPLKFQGLFIKGVIYNQHQESTYSKHAPCEALAKEPICPQEKSLYNNSVQGQAQENGLRLKWGKVRKKREGRRVQNRKEREHS